MQNLLPPLKIVLIHPRGFCAGVKRAVDIVNKALEIHGNPIYVRHEIVHNKTVVEEFKNKGVIFVNDVDEIPAGSTAIFSAHGVSCKVETEAKERTLNYIDATCPLVKKVHKIGLDYYNEGYQIILVGHKGHPEVEGTFGRIPNNIFIVSSTTEAEKIIIDESKPLAYITQTTLSLDDTKDIIAVLKSRFPNIAGPDKNICYATQNRQNAIKSIINDLDSLIVIGSKNSSNSNRLKEIGDKHGKLAFLIDNKNEIPFDKIQEVQTLGISAGASAPDSAINDIINAIKTNRQVIAIEDYEYTKEDVIFHLPKELR
ncbi:MAG: 4-hydroxy-3-methylbut-2-enyl diphosphate reductase [Alphaproteobacteria bacterium]|jgi:4-hydroxy-3-methylbut-2-enyl diphosphate reductase|nr:4-hydroxy-3-methylbut-2-enyl diphosphate reductase [Alphaproteobacteria bacterium]